MSGKTKDVSYRKAYKSNHLGVQDIEEMIEEGKSTIVTVKEVWYEEGANVAGKNGNFNIAYFEGDIKPLVLNAGNSNILRNLCGGGALLSSWKLPVRIELYHDPNVKMGKDVVGGVRIRKEKPAPIKQPIKDSDWPNALKAVEGGQYTVAQLKETRTLTPEQVKELDEMAEKLNKK